MRRTIFALTAAVALVLSACGNNDTTVPQGGASTPASSPTTDGPVGAQVQVPLAAQNDSGITGTAALIESTSGKTTVTVTLTGAGPGPQPAHIHPGTCDNLDPKPKYPLQNIESGRSTTEIPVDLETLRAGKFAVNVHKSPSEVQIYVACGDISRS